MKKIVKIHAELIASGEASGIAALSFLKVAAQDGQRLLEFEDGAAVIVARGERMVAAQLRTPLWFQGGIVGSATVSGAEALAVFGALWGRLRGRYRIFRYSDELEDELNEMTIDGAILTSCLAIDDYHKN